MKITLEPTESREHLSVFHNKVEISYPDDDLSLNEILEYLIKPALYGMTYGGVDEFFDNEPQPSEEDDDSEIEQ